jgi:hypothetical protein
MRLAGIEKGGFYPYPSHIAEATASWFNPLPAGTRGRLLDPCAGEGENSSLLGKLLNCETWAASCSPTEQSKPLPVWPGATAPPGKAAPSWTSRSRCSGSTHRMMTIDTEMRNGSSWLS